MIMAGRLNTIRWAQKERNTGQRRLLVQLRHFSFSLLVMRGFACG